MLNVTPLLSINLSTQTSWGPGPCPCTPPCKPSRSWQSLPACPPHLAVGPSNTHREPEAHSECARMGKDVRVHTRQWAHACKLRPQETSLHTFFFFARRRARLLLATLLVHRATGRLCTIPLKVLWAVISKTIPWMAALIENNEGHIEHMVAVVSPFPPSSLLLSPSLSLPTPPDKRFSQTSPQQSKDLCGECKRERTSSKLFPFPSDKSLSI